MVCAVALRLSSTNLRGNVHHVWYRFDQDSQRSHAARINFSSANQTALILPNEESESENETARGAKEAFAVEEYRKECLASKSRVAQRCVRPGPNECTIARERSRALAFACCRSRQKSGVHSQRSVQGELTLSPDNAAAYPRLFSP
jgi:hypothetical protein